MDDQVVLNTSTNDDLVDFDEELASEDIIEVIFGKEEAKEFKLKNRGASLSSIIKLEDAQPSENHKENNSEIVSEIIFYFAGNRKILDYCYLSESIEELERGDFLNVPEITLKNGITRMLGPRLENEIYSKLGTKATSRRVTNIINESSAACLQAGAIFESAKEAREWLSDLQDKALKIALSRGVRIVKDIEGEEIERFYALNILDDPENAQNYIESMGFRKDNEENLECAYSGFANILKVSAFEESDDFTLLDWYYDMFDFDSSAEKFLDYMHRFISKNDKGRIIAKYFEEYIINRNKEQDDQEE